VEFFHRVFEWEAASYALYPGWWKIDGLPRPDLPATHFLNAAWARLFLTVRPGFERLALRWIVGGAIETELDPDVEDALNEILDEMTEYRVDNFGDPLEAPVADADGLLIDSAVDMMRWRAEMPTDGTHAEVVQGVTTGADDATAREIDDAARLRDATITRKIDENAAIERSTALITSEPAVALGFSAPAAP
jgi:hypothetical protein